MNLSDLTATASGTKLFCTEGTSNKFYQAHLTLLPSGEWVAWAEHARIGNKKIQRSIVRETIAGQKLDSWKDPAKARLALNKRIVAKHKKGYRPNPGTPGDGTL